MLAMKTLRQLEEYRRQTTRIPRFSAFLLLSVMICHPVLLWSTGFSPPLILSPLETLTESLRVPSHTPVTCMRRHPTTIIELALVLGYTFHAYSCAVHMT